MIHLQPAEELYSRQVIPYLSKLLSYTDLFSRRGTPPAIFLFTMNRKTKQRIAAFHWVLGLIILIPLFIASISGTALVFREEMESWFEPEFYQLQPDDTVQSLDELAAIVDLYTNTPVSYLTLPSKPERAYEFVLSDNTVVFVDPYRGRVIGRRDLYGGPAGWLYNLHSKLLTGRSGEIILGIIGFAVIILFVSGTCLWVRRKHPLRRKIKIKLSGSTRKINFDLHKAAGIFTGLLLTLSAATGSALIFYNSFSQLTHSVAQQPVAVYPVLSSDTDVVNNFSATQASQIANSAVPDAELKRIVWPTADNSAVQVRFQQESEVHPNGMSFVYLDSRNNYNLISASKADEAEFPVNINHWLYPLHSGKWGWWDFILIITGISGILLAVTGILNVKNMKWNKKN